MKKPPGVFGVAALFLAAAAYLVMVGVVMLASPGLIPLSSGAPLLGGMEVAGPYAFLLGAGFASLVGYGLLRLNNWARRGAIVAAVVGMILLVPAVSSSIAAFRFRTLVSAAAAIIVRTIVLWYLFQAPVRDIFERK
jgi:hypothetical protein